MVIDSGIIATGLVGVLGILVTIYVMRTPRPYYIASRMSLGGVSHPRIAIQFDGGEVPNVHSVRLVLWNSGRKPIRQGDIPTGDAAPTIVLSSNARVLSRRCKCSNKGTAESKVVDGNKVSFSFEYLNHKDALLCEVLCTTDDKKTPTVRFSGNVIGATIKQGASLPQGQPVSAAPVFYAVLFGAAALPAYGAYRLGIKTLDRVADQNLPLSAGFGALAVTAAALSLFLAFHIARDLLSSIPKKHVRFLHTPVFPDS